MVTDTAGGTGHLVFRATRYEPGYEGLSDQQLEAEGLLRIPPAAANSRATIRSY